LKLNNKRGFDPSFFYKNNVIINLFFRLSIIKKEHNFDAFTIDLYYINGKFNSGIKIQALRGK